MTHTIIYIIKINFCLILLLAAVGCDYDNPAQLYPKESAPKPVITRMEPESASNGIISLKIVGENFSSKMSENFVYFGSVEGKITAATPAELTVLRPLDIAGDVTVKVAVAGAFLMESFGPYHLESGLSNFDDFGIMDRIALDKDENIYIADDDIVYKVTPQGEANEYGIADFKPSDMKMGPGGYLYLLKTENKILRRIAPGGGGEAENFIRFVKKASFFDFDSQGIVYAGSEDNGLMVTTLDETINFQADLYDGLAVKSVRVYDDYVYVAIDTVVGNELSGKGIFRHKITGFGEVGEREMVLNWENLESYQGLEILDITFSEEGLMYIGTDHQNPVIVVDGGGSWTPIFAGLLQGPATQLCWGGGNYLYMHRRAREEDDAGITRIVMGKKSAPYFGWE